MVVVRRLVVVLVVPKDIYLSNAVERLEDLLCTVYNFLHTLAQVGMVVVVVIFMGPDWGSGGQQEEGCYQYEGGERLHAPEYSHRCSELVHDRW